MRVCAGEQEEIKERNMEEDDMPSLVFRHAFARRRRLAQARVVACLALGRV